MTIDIYVINLKKRTDRLLRVKNDFENYNLIIVEAIEDGNQDGQDGNQDGNQDKQDVRDVRDVRDVHDENCAHDKMEKKVKNGWIGCFKSHQKIIRIGKEKKLPYIIAMEDDCKIVDKTTFDSGLKNIIDWAENNKDKWNIFLGGVTKVWDYTNLIELDNGLKLLSVNEGKTAHFVIYNSNCYDYYLNLESDIPIDKCWHNKLVGIVPVPFIAVQYTDYSDIENKKVDYGSRFVSIENNFIKMINSGK